MATPCGAPDEEHTATKTAGRVVIWDSNRACAKPESYMATSTVMASDTEVRRSVLEKKGVNVTRQEQTVIDAIGFARSVLNRAQDSSPASLELFRYGPWVPIPMARIRHAEREYWKDDLIRPVAAILHNSIFHKELEIEEREEMYDGNERKEWHRFMTRHLGQLARDAFHQMMVCGYAVWVPVPDDRFGCYPKCVSFSTTQHEFRESATDVEFRITHDPTAITEKADQMSNGLVMNLSSSSSSSGAALADNAQSVPLAVRNAFGVGTHDAAPPSSRSDGRNGAAITPASVSSAQPFLLPARPPTGTGSEFVFRMNPRIFVKCLDKRPSRATGVNSRVMSAMNVITTARFFMDNARMAEEQRRRTIYMTSTPPPPRPDTQTALGSALGASAAGGICPTVDQQRAMMAGLNSTGNNMLFPPAAMSAATQAGGRPTASALNDLNMQGGAMNALQYAHNAFLYGGMQARLMKNGLMATNGSGGGPNDITLQPIGTGNRYADGNPIYQLLPGERLEALPPHAPHDDPIRYAEDYASEHTCNLFGVPRQLFQRIKTGSLNTSTTHENDPSVRLLRENSAQIVRVLCELLEDAYRQCYFIEFASRIPGRVYVPGPATVRVEREEKERRSGQLRKPPIAARKLLEKNLRTVLMRRRVLDALNAQSTADITRMVSASLSSTAATTRACELDTENSDWTSSATSAEDSDVEDNASSSGDESTDSDDDKDEKNPTPRRSSRRAAAAAAAAVNATTVAAGAKRKRGDETASTPGRRNGRRARKSKSKGKQRATRRRGAGSDATTMKRAAGVPELRVPPERRRELLLALGKQLREAITERSANDCMMSIDGLFGTRPRRRDVEAIVSLIRAVEKTSGAVDPLPPKSTQERILDLGITVSFPSRNSFPTIAYLAAEGYMRDGAVKRAANLEFGIPLSELNDRPQPPAVAAGAGAAAAAPAVARPKGKGSPSGKMASITRRTTKGPSSSNKDGSPKVSSSGKRPAKPAAAATAKAKSKRPEKQGERSDSSSSDDDAESDTDKEPGKPKRSRKAKPKAAAAAADAATERPAKRRKRQAS